VSSSDLGLKAEYMENFTHYVQTVEVLY